MCSLLPGSGVFCVFGPVCLLVGPCWFSCHGLEVLTSSCVWWVKLWHGVLSALLAACVSYVLSVVVCFLHPWFCGVALFAGGPVPGSVYTLFCSLGPIGPGGGLGGGLGGLGGLGGGGGRPAQGVVSLGQGEVRVLVLPGS